MNVMLLSGIPLWPNVGKSNPKEDQHFCGSARRSNDYWMIIRFVCWSSFNFFFVCGMNSSNQKSLGATKMRNFLCENCLGLLQISYNPYTSLASLGFLCVTRPHINFYLLSDVSLTVVKRRNSCTIIVVASCAWICH